MTDIFKEQACVECGAVVKERSELNDHYPSCSHSKNSRYINIVFDGPPGHVAGRFVEVENDAGASINAGEWIERSDKSGQFWVLRIPVEMTGAERELVKAAVEIRKKQLLFKESGGDGTAMGTAAMRLQTCVEAVYEENKA